MSLRRLSKTTVKGVLNVLNETNQSDRRERERERDVLYINLKSEFIKMGHAS